MIKKEIAPGIIVCSDVIPNNKELYQKIKKALSSPLSNSSWIRPKCTMAESKDLEKFINLDITSLFFEYFNPIEEDYIKYYGGVPVTWHDVYGVVKYSTGQECINHIDDGLVHHRRISVVHYLNDNYTGGEINFPRFNINFKPKANDLLLFPSTYVYNHSVSPIIKGERYCVVSWLR
jgi:hypothetical protein